MRPLGDVVTRSCNLSRAFCAVVFIFSLAGATFATGLSERDTHGSDTLGSASAHPFKTDLDEQWEDIVAVRSRPVAILDARLTSQRHHHAAT